jgi:tetratricopeptide (TPR) repeat protein
MSLLRSIAVVLLITLGTAVTWAQFQESGTGDYALGNSSVMWLPRSSSLFLNPGELAHVRQGEFLITAGRFRTLESMSAAFFVPYVGTFGLGVAPVDNLPLASIGYARVIGGYSMLGGALSLPSEVAQGFRFSFGGSLHVPFNIKESGMHVGLSATNVPTKPFVNAGIGFWVIPKTLRLQLATQTRTERAAFVGIDVKVLEALRLQVGTRGFQKINGGVSYATPNAILEFGGGPQGISFTMNVRLGEAASEIHSREYDQGNEAFTDQRYAEAYSRFRIAEQYDEYDSESRLMALRSLRVMDSSITDLLGQARSSEDQNEFPTAMKVYVQILKMDPGQTAVTAKLTEAERRLRTYIRQLLATGDSLRDRKQVTGAKRMYDLALELDPENDSASARIDELDNLSKENVKSILNRARTYLNKNQYDEAQREYEHALSIEPKNAQGRAGLIALRNRRIGDQLTLGKEAFKAGNYFDALGIFADIIRNDENNKDAQSYLDRTRDALKGDVDRLFKTGLQLYVKEDFKGAIAEWDKVLMIQPRDSSTFEYRKRADEKLKALDKFK